MRWWCGGVVGARCRPFLEIFSDAVVEERALEHGPSETNPRFPPATTRFRWDVSYLWSACSIIIFIYKHRMGSLIL